MEIKSLYILTTFLVSMSALFLSIIASLIIIDNEDLEKEVGEIKESLKVDIVEDTFQEYYSVFNKKGGWVNFSCLCLGVGIGTFVISLFGYFGVHKKTVVLLLSFLVLVLVSVMLQIGCLMLLKMRRHEFLTFYYFSSYRSEDSGDFKHEVKKILLVLSLMWSTVTLITVITNLFVRRNISKKESEVVIQEA